MILVAKIRASVQNSKEGLFMHLQVITYLICINLLTRFLTDIMYMARNRESRYKARCLARVMGLPL